MTDEPRAVLDVCAGLGDIARHLADVASRVDAVDFSLPMIEMGKQLPDGNHPHLHWIYGKVEDVPLTPPYALIITGSSIHWTELRVAFPQFRSLLTPNGTRALIYRRALPMPWDADLRKLRAGFSERQNRRPTDTVAELKTRGYFHMQGEKQTSPVPFLQSVEDFIVGLHSRSSFSVERMGEPRVTEFDQQVRALLSQFHSDGIVSLQVVGTVTWDCLGLG